MAEQYPKHPGADEPYGQGDELPPRRGNGFAVAALVLGIIGVALFWVPFVGALLGILALVFAIVGISRAKKRAGAGKGLAIAGLVLGILPPAILALQIALIASVVSVSGSTEKAKRSMAHLGISQVKMTIDLFIAMNKDSLPPDLAALVEAGLIKHVDEFDNGYYNDYTWVGATIHPTTKKFHGEIIAHPSAGSPPASIKYDGATGIVAQKP